MAHGHTVRLMAPKFVAPYRLSGKRAKNDAADAAAICEAVQRPSIRFVPVKTEAQQAQVCVHRAREAFVEARTATLNRIRGLLSEFGIALPLKAATVGREAALRLEDLPGLSNMVIADCSARYIGSMTGSLSTTATSCRWPVETLGLACITA
jgi:transposase